MKELFLIRGLPGSGKTTFALKIALIVLAADDYFVNGKTGEYNFDASKIKDAHEFCRSQCEEYMRKNNRSIAVNNTFTKEWEMKNYLAMAEKYGYTVTTLIVENRHGGKNIHNVPEKTIEDMRNRFEFSL